MRIKCGRREGLSVDQCAGAAEVRGAPGRHPSPLAASRVQGGRCVDDSVRGVLCFQWLCPVIRVGQASPHMEEASEEGAGPPLPRAVSTSVLRVRPASNFWTKCYGLSPRVKCEHLRGSACVLGGIGHIEDTGPWAYSASVLRINPTSWLQRRRYKELYIYRDLTSLALSLLIGTGFGLVVIPTNSGQYGIHGVGICSVDHTTKHHDSPHRFRPFAIVSGGLRVSTNMTKPFRIGELKVRRAGLYCDGLNMNATADDGE
ncbi:hypothetical protein AAG570_005224 [Ranatra chinensis]|uniref:Uncharacterized protein n=1 Tax=Ranatra chinensis TaxID=642074 RepID=A0ABD0XZU8_9HEMI